MRTKRTMQDDSLTRKVMAEVAAELNMSPDKIHKATQHFFKWQREAFNNLEHESYLWNYFGTFKTLPGRCDHYMTKLKAKEEQNINNINNTNNTTNQ
jgi:hypothetical protein